MPIKSEEIVPLNQVRARFTELAEEVRAGAKKIITRNGKSYVAWSTPDDWTITTASSVSKVGRKR